RRCYAPDDVELLKLGNELKSVIPGKINLLILLVVIALARALQIDEAILATESDDGRVDRTARLRCALANRACIHAAGPGLVRIRDDRAGGGEKSLVDDHGVALAHLRECIAEQ